MHRALETEDKVTTKTRELDNETERRSKAEDAAKYWKDLYGQTFTAVQRMIAGCRAL